MSNLLKLFAFIGILAVSDIKAQDSIPLLTGKVIISVKTGMIDCDLSLQNIPRINDYFIRINSGMNLRFFRNIAGNNLMYYSKSLSDTMASGEANAYYFRNSRGDGKFLPKAIQFRYVGMYPVLTDTSKDFAVADWKGNIAFNGYSVRADGKQTAWYPVLYDIKKDISYENLKYDIEIECADCNAIYVNGSLPVSGSRAHLKSDKPQQLTLFCGNYKIENIDGNYFLNPDISASQLKSFAGTSESYKHYFEKNLGIPYKEKITYIQTTPISKNNAWLFVTYPTIVNIGFGVYGMRSFVDSASANEFKPYLAHELGHYYFGTYLDFNTALGDMLREAFPEFLSLKIARNLIADSIAKKKWLAKIEALKGFNAVPFSKVKTSDDYRDRELYVYYYAPLILMAIEQRIGEKKMWEWMKNILTAKPGFTDYDFFKSTLDKTLKNPTTMAAIEQDLLLSDKSLANAIATIHL